jgi:hypothetical protein
LRDKSGQLTPVYHTGEPLSIEIEFDGLATVTEPEFGVGFDDVMGARIFSVASSQATTRLSAIRGRKKAVCLIDELPLAPGRYLLSFTASSRAHGTIDGLERAIAIDVLPTDFYGSGIVPDSAQGAVVVRSRWSHGD